MSREQQPLRFVAVRSASSDGRSYAMQSLTMMDGINYRQCLLHMHRMEYRQVYGSARLVRRAI